MLEVNAWAWDKYWQENRLKAFPADLTAAEWFDRYLSAFIDLFLHHSDILRYNQYFNAYIQREGIPHDRMQSFSQVIDVIRAGFRRIYQRARKDGTLRTDVPENEIFSASLHLMLAAVTRYAVGLAYDAGIPPERELLLLKNMLMREYVIQE